ncbi:unnamed protein product [Kuraishia capsulata CBS 1993]|uniref:Glycosylphosphatidylinositol anchor biosynthesis protein 11 n=1 Tax=Kuraishia capsulata CBS 1993 TaxID=1382522 RepID=W6MID2_9ASCO|nr:uncharacterized protein KUCA_T00002185001 [Kuraishia capsulata CBS 1993]CDK26214.1 unnamed protein product [Kuraishia capsulata CBS 1993]
MTSKAQRMPRIKKTVSFSDVPKIATIPPNDSQLTADSKTTSQNSSSTWVPKLNKTVLTVPFHIPMFAYSLFEHYNITTDAVSAMSRSLVVLVAFQVVYALILMQNISESPKKKKTKKTVKKARVRAPESGDFLYVTFACGVTLLGTLPLFIVLILFGAPFTVLLKETYLLAVHISFLVLLPLLIVYKIADNDSEVQPSTVWSKLLTFEVADWYKQPAFTMAIGGVVGTWLGAIPIPLDWDRNWQTWPITLLVGAYGGAFVGNVLGQLASLV